MRVFDVADTLRACLVSVYATAVTDDGEDAVPDKIEHRPGAVAPLLMGTAEDECCAGLAWVRIAEIAPVLEPGATEQADYNPCDHPGRRVTIELGTVRCNPFGTAQKGPDGSTWANLAQRLDTDALRMRQAVCCYAANDQVGEDKQVTRVVPGTWTPLESSGGCAGGTMPVYVWIVCEECT